MYSKNTVLSVCYNISGTILIVLRCALLKNLNQLKYITVLLEEFKVNKATENILWLKVLTALTVLLQIAMLAYKLCIRKQLVYVSSFLFGYKVERESYQDVIAILLDINSLFFSFMPLLTFALFYTTVCYRISCIINRFAETLASKSELNYEILLHSYTKMKSAVIYIDNTVGALVFTTVIYSSCVMCFTLYFVLESNLFIDAINRVIVCHLILIIFSLLMVMSVSASKVEETSSEISSLALTLPKNKQSCFFDQQRFILLAEKGIAMTMWKIVPIRRSFIFSISGILFSYTLMFYNMNPLKKN
ncbi:uncharacterized protein TNIN_137701 [Trichonephila inaurata madagascariensis]|uniref:Uncharacterized protein n=1 Tax=Trichonephila inaurata madagascariensis TaxID=2747483 RepID=A0A8X6X395_9ARAC|nr:uncharacterized protein TNIN_137701 [Trichonephila inaurata madagascariensis]